MLNEMMPSKVILNATLPPVVILDEAYRSEVKDLICQRKGFFAYAQNDKESIIINGTK